MTKEGDNQQEEVLKQENNTNPYQQAYVGPPSGTQPTYTPPPIYTAPNFPPSGAPTPGPDQPSLYSAYPPQPYPPGSYPPQPYPPQGYPPQPYPQPYPPQAYPNQPYPPQGYPPQPYPPQPYPSSPQAEQPVIIVHSSTAHAIDSSHPLPCGGLGFAWLMFILGWFIGIAWFFGAFYACMGDPRERRGGRACLIVLILWVALIIFLVATTS